jgi:hypothetical protein
MRRQQFTFWFSTSLCILTTGMFGWSRLNWDSSIRAPMGEADFASKGEVETIAQCSDDRKYLENTLKLVHPDYRSTRAVPTNGTPPRECVSFIMQNFIGLDSPSGAIARCSTDKNKNSTLTTGYKPACVTDNYVNAVYNSLADVTDCLNINMKELLPKLYNESGLHVNTLGGGYDAGVGQLTVSALREVYMRYNGIPKNPTSLEWYMREIAKSPKESCKRIVKQKSAYTVAVPKGKKFCAYGDPENANCYQPWIADHRCTVISTPDNPLRNILYTGIFYRSMVRSATGITFNGGDDFINGQLMTNQDTFGGYMGNSDFVARLQALGATHADQKIVKQMLVSFGFNAGVKTGKIFLENYLKQREAKGKALNDADFDFQTIASGKWSVISNMPTYWRGLGSDDPLEFDKGLKALEVLKELGLDATKPQKQYTTLRPLVQKELANIDAKKISDDAKKALIVKLKIKIDEYRRPLLAAVFAKSDELSFPEFMRIAHGSAAVTDGTGGAPGYLNFLAQKHKQLETEMGDNVCTAEKYLHF